MPLHYATGATYAGAGMLHFRLTLAKEQNMIRSALSKVAWVGRTASMVLALVLGVASMAFGANGQAWILGQGNVATAITSLGGAAGVDGPMVRITNNDSGTDDTALDLRVQSGEAPLRVDSDRKVANLNADQLDGVDSARLLRNSIYERSRATTGGSAPNETVSAFIGCNSGDTALGGGFDNMDNGTHLIASRTTTALGGGHIVSWRNNHTVDTVTLIAICADMVP